MFRKSERIAELEVELRQKEYEISKLEYLLFEARMLNDSLTKAIMSKDTEIFVYKGDTYKVRTLRLSRKPNCLDTLNVELVKWDTVFSYDGGLVGTIKKAMDEVNKTFKGLMYGDTDKEVDNE